MTDEESSGAEQLQHETHDRRAEVSLCIVVLIWGLNIPTVKYAVGFVDPLVFNELRLVISALCLWFTDSLEARRSGPRPAIPWKPVIQISLLGNLLYQVAFICGTKLTTAGCTALLLASIPVWTAIVAFFAGEERLQPREWGGLFCAFLGTAIVTFDGNFSQGRLIGNLLILSAAVMWAVATVMTRRAMTGISPNRLAFVVALVALPFHLLIAVPFADTKELAATSGYFWLAVLFSGALSTGIGYSLWNYGVKRIGSARAAVFQNMAPVIALAASWAVLGEDIVALQIAGGCMILFGLFVMRSARTTRAAKKT